MRVAILISKSLKDMIKKRTTTHSKVGKKRMNEGSFESHKAKVDLMLIPNNKRSRDNNKTKW